MNHFFLLNEAIDLQDFELFKLGMSELVALEKMENDTFNKHKSVWALPIIKDKLFYFYGQEAQAISKFIEQLDNLENYISDEETFDKAFPNSDNAFLGIDFSDTTISEKKQIMDENTFKTFKNNILWNIDFRNLWTKREALFPNLVLCGAVEQQIAKIGNSNFFNQIVEKLKEFDKAIQTWQEGAFSYKEINKHFALRISPESEQTMSKYGKERSFKLPNGASKIFELHIKTGELRFHFFVDNATKIVYIGYIGKHLTTISG